jgi:hypothetical protein
MKKDIIDILKPKKIKWLIEEKTNQFMIPLYNKIYLCNQLKIDYEKENNMVYDLCIRIRPDLYIKNYIPDNIITNIEKDVIYSPYHDDLDFVTNISFMGLTDQLWFADSNTMNKICNLYLDLPKYINDTCLTSEIILKTYIKNINIKINYFKNYYFIIEKINYEKISIFSLIYYFWKKDSSLKCYKLLIKDWMKKKNNILSESESESESESYSNSEYQ